MSAITTHVLDLVRGAPAAGVRVTLEVEVPGRGWVALAERTTDADGRVRDLIAPGSPPDPGRYRLTFATGAWFESRGEHAFHPRVTVDFVITDATRHHHVPLLLSPYGYSTYRGS
jgi:5-hydroxyisourate hydrolase